MNRREFLKGLLGSSVSVFLTRHLPRPDKEEIVEEAVGELLRAEPCVASAWSVEWETWLRSQ